MKWHHILLVATWAATVCQAQSDYCRISRQHTLCQYQGVGRRCGGDGPLSQGLSDLDKRSVVSAHNEFRSRVAAGSELHGRPGPQPPAADMMEMAWDDELAAVAQRWSDQCTFGHDTSRDVPRFGVGQNVYQSSSSRREQADQVIRKAIKSWYDEVQLFDRSDVARYSFSQGTGHYTAMVWSKTDRIGCGSTEYQEGGFTHTYLVCNYGRSGNLLGAPMYTQGPACSACPSGTTCSPQGNLCRAAGAGSSGPDIAPIPPTRPSLPPVPQRPLPTQPPQLQRPVQRPVQPSNIVFDTAPFTPVTVTNGQQPNGGQQAFPLRFPIGPIRPIDTNSIDQSALFFGQRPQRPRPSQRPSRGMLDRFIAFITRPMRG